MSFNEQFDQHGAWRRDFALRLKRFAEWVKEQGLLNAAMEDRMLRLQAQVRSDKVMVAFVAEFSRGKSELINAIFFAGYGRRIMPASAGRTTMCTIELGYDPEMVPCLRLLPIETRMQPQALMAWRLMPEKWFQIELQVDNPAQLAEAFQKAAEVQHVTLEKARALGFWNDDRSEDHPPIAADGRVEVPKWRHALVNIAHPLLKQGLVILDTPGLNAIGAEPELTVSLIPQAHAVVFVLAADTGVTRSDLSIWHEHLDNGATGSDNRLVVLNKIDTLWDALTTPEQVQAQIDRKSARSAEILGLQCSQVLAVSAQKGLVAKITHDDVLLQASQLPVLELALAKSLLGQRQNILRTAVAASIQELNNQAARALTMRRRDQTDQMLELRGLRGKHSSVIQRMRKRIEHEQAEFSGSSARLHAIRTVHNSLLGDVVHLLGLPTLRAELAGLTAALKQPGIKLRLKKTYSETFSGLRKTLHQAQTTMAEIQAMLDSSFGQINAEFGFSLKAGRAPDMTQSVQDLELIERSHLQYISLGNVMRMAQAGFSDRLVRALSGRVRMVFESALGEVELWNQSASAQLDAQMRERRQGFVKRLDAIARIDQAALMLDERISEINQQLLRLRALETMLGDLTSQVLAMEPLPLSLQPLPDCAGHAAHTPLAELA
jgi:hypothetical protein